MYKVFVLALILMISMQAQCVTDDTDYKCLTEGADVVFLLDASSSIWLEDFNKQKQFVNYFIDHVPIGIEANKVNVGVVTFSTNAVPNIYLSDFNNKVELKEKVLNISQKIGNTNTDLALDLLNNSMFTDEKGARENVRHIAFILTDGNPRNQNRTELAAEKCRNAGIELFAIGIGNKINKDHMKQIVTEPKESHYIHISDYKALLDTKGDILKTICKPNPVQEQECMETYADVFFLLDSSGSIARDDFRKQLNIVEDIIQTYDVGSDKLRIGMSLFSNNYKQVVGFNDGVNKSVVLEKIRNAIYLGGSTKTGQALHKIRTEIFTTENKISGRGRFLIIFTDGKSHDSNFTIEEADKLKGDGVTIFSVGIGSGIDKKELDSISSAPPDEYVFTVDDMDDLSRKVEVLSSKTCTKFNEKTPSDEEYCNETYADVFFLLDSSGSIDLDEFVKQLNIVEDIIQTYDVGSDKMRIGMSLFSDYYTQVVGFNDGVERSVVLEKIRNAIYLGGTTNTGHALRKIRTEIFTAENKRSGRGRFLIIFTDGKSYDSDLTIEEADKLKGDGVTIFSVGIGSGIDKKELDSISSAPPDEYVFTVQNMDDLSRKVKDLSSKTCTKFNEKTSSGEEYCNSTKTTDFVFALRNNYFGVRKTVYILKAIGAIIERKIIREKFRFGIVFDQCFQDISFEYKDNNWKKNSEYETKPFSTIFGKLNRQYSGTNRRVSLLFVHESMNLADRTLVSNITALADKKVEIYLVVIGKKTNFVVNKLVPSTHIIFIPSYKDLRTKFYNEFIKVFCVKTSRRRHDLS